MENNSLTAILKANLSEQDLIDLGLIRNPIYDNHEVVKEIKATLNNFQDIGDELGIEYAWALIADDEPTQRELEHALDDMNELKEEHNPATKRSNFWYVDKQRNEQFGYTRYLLANGGERIVTDDEMQSNPWFAYQRNLSDAREDGDFEEYNRLKDEWRATHIKTSITTDAEQCFIKVWTKFYGDAVNIPANMIDAFNRPTKAKTYRQSPEYKLVSYLSMFSPEFKQLQKLQTKIKLISIDNKCLAIL